MRDSALTYLAPRLGWLEWLGAGWTSLFPHVVAHPKLSSVTFRYQKDENRSCKSSQGMASDVPENHFHCILLGRASHKPVPHSRGGKSDSPSWWALHHSCWGRGRIFGGRIFGWYLPTIYCTPPFIFFPSVINNWFQGQSATASKWGIYLFLYTFIQITSIKNLRCVGMLCARYTEQKLL